MAAQSLLPTLHKIERRLNDTTVAAALEDMPANSISIIPHRKKTLSLFPIFHKMDRRPNHRTVAAASEDMPIIIANFV